MLPVKPNIVDFMNEYLVEDITIFFGHVKEKEDFIFRKKFEVANFISLNT